MTLVELVIPDSSNITIELNDKTSPKTVKQFISHLPFSQTLNVWGEEIYTNESPVNIPEENAVSCIA